ncbi:HCP-like protein [Hortaea werneckii]|nr:HCP-like protein [Hortaea werneckii]
MPGLKDLLKKKEEIAQETRVPPADDGHLTAPPGFRFVRTTTESEEQLHPPGGPEDEKTEAQAGTSEEGQKSKKRHTLLGFRRSSNAPDTKDAVPPSPEPAEKGNSQQLPVRPKSERRLSDRFSLRRDRSRSASAETSPFMPDNLPEAPATAAVPSGTLQGTSDEVKHEKESREAQWEKRATLLAQSNKLLREEERRREHNRSRSQSPSISDRGGDENIQEAIQLHESGDLENSTAMFGRLAQPEGANNALAQVLYGLALRHGWGIPPEPEKAIHYLSLAASNSAAIEELALNAGMKKGGAAKGELVLAIFELANCFRQGWGTKKYPVAARQYYETAANLGDTDAMEEAAWCYLEGFGGGKDKFKAAQFLRLAEEKGGKALVGNSWIWKDKYNPK